MVCHFQYTMPYSLPMNIEHLSILMSMDGVHSVMFVCSFIFFLNFVGGKAKIKH